jgi:omega-6 fatty acid desaturase (delta-12 desaturase)
MACSLFTFVPYHYWRRTHAMHHAAAGDMEHRGVGDYYTMTVKEYAEKTKWEQFKYRLYRNPIIMFVIAPVFVFIIGYRFDYMRRKDWTRERRGLLWTNLALLALVVGLSLLIGFKAYVLVQLPIVFLATGVGAWFFFVQHNFEDAYWAQGEEWDYTTAALQGSSYYKLPRILQWFTGSIGFHHIHHLSPKIPNYLLEQAHNENEIFQTPVTLTLITGFKQTGLSLWDEDNKKLISFRQFKKQQRAGMQPVEASV